MSHSAATPTNAQSIAHIRVMRYADCLCGSNEKASAGWLFTFAIGVAGEIKPCSTP